MQKEKIGDWGLGIGDWAIPNPQSPIPKCYDKLISLNFIDIILNNLIQFRIFIYNITKYINNRIKLQN